jgi:hypothetical protein
MSVSRRAEDAVGSILATRRTAGAMRLRVLESAVNKAGLPG